MSLDTNIKMEFWEEEAGEGLVLSTNYDFPGYITIKITSDKDDDIVIPMEIFEFIYMVSNHKEGMRELKKAAGESNREMEEI